MRTLQLICALSLGALSVTACKKKVEAPAPAPVDLRTQVSALISPIAAVEGLNADRVALGARLYHDPNLSKDGTISCASCHVIAEGGGDGKSHSPGVGGALGGVNSPTSLNSHLNFVQFWDGRAATLAEQALGPIENPVEMANTLEAVVAYLQSEPSYVDQFATAYEGAITKENVADAIATFEHTLTTPNSAFDRWLQGDDAALNAQERAGLETFMEVGCASCHVGPGLGGTMYQRMGLVNSYFEGRELTEGDHGRFNVTKAESDRHMFKVPLLRNVALTAPYFHDGSVTTLDDAVTKMAHHQLGVTLEAQQVADITAFLHTLTGEIPAVDITALNLPAARLSAPAEGSADSAPEGTDAP